MERITNYFLTRKTKEVFQLYLLTIFLFGYIYWIFSIPFVKSGKEISLAIGQAMYFSVVTITTLGYGDISPLNNWGMLLTGLEAILGIITLGLFLNSISMKIANRQQKELKHIETTMEIMLYYNPNYSIINSYYFSITELFKSFERIKFPSFDNNQISKDKIEEYKNSLDKELNVISTLLLKVMKKDKSKTIDILDNIYTVSDPIINLKLKNNINNLKVNKFHVMVENAIPKLKDDAKLVFEKGDIDKIFLFSGNLLAIKKWIEQEYLLIESITQELDNISSIKKGV